MFKLLAGDFPLETHFYDFGSPVLSSPNGTYELRNNIDKVEILSEEKSKSILGSATWGIVGAVALGPIGAIAGLLGGGNRNRVCFACYLKDGKKFMAVADHKIYAGLQAIAFAGQRFSLVTPTQSLPSQKPGEQYCSKCEVYRGVINVEYGAAEGISVGTCPVCGALCHFHTPGTPAISGDIALKRMRERMAVEKKYGLSMEASPSHVSPPRKIEQIKSRSSYWTSKVILNAILLSLMVVLFFTGIIVLIVKSSVITPTNNTTAAPDNPATSANPPANNIVENTPSATTMPIDHPLPPGKGVPVIDYALSTSWSGKRLSVNGTTNLPDGTVLDYQVSHELLSMTLHEHDNPEEAEANDKEIQKAKSLGYSFKTNGDGYMVVSDGKFSFDADCSYFPPGRVEIWVSFLPGESSYESPKEQQPQQVLDLYGVHGEYITGKYYVHGTPTFGPGAEIVQFDTIPSID